MPGSEMKKATADRREAELKEKHWKRGGGLIKDDLGTAEQ